MIALLVTFSAFMGGVHCDVYADDDAALTHVQCVLVAKPVPFHNIRTFGATFLRLDGS